MSYHQNYPLDIYIKLCLFFKNLIIHEDNVLEYTDKNYAAKEGGVRQMLTGLTKGVGGVLEMLTMAYEGGRGGEGCGNADKC